MRWSTPAETQEAEKRRSRHFYTTSYLTKHEALKTVFPSATRVVREDLTLSPRERDDVEKLLGSRLRKDAFTVYLGVTESGELDGYAVVQEEIGKFKLITFIVGVEPSGKVRRVAVMVYREARGGEVAQRRFLVQYQGKTVDAAFSINRDIINITGATMSVSSMNAGVKKVLAVIETIYGRDPARIRRGLERAEEEHEFSTEQASHPREHPIRRRHAHLVMGSLCEIEAWGSDPRRIDGACREAFLEIERVDRALSDYRVDSELSRLSGRAPGEWVPISDLTAEFLEQARELSRASAGAFDLTVGPLVDAWGFRAEPRAPSRAELRAVRTLVDHRKVELRRERSGRPFARLTESGMRLDPGGLGKGFAVDRAARVLRACGVERALVNFSGCMYALGSPPGRSGWPVAVRDPARPDEVLGHVLLRDEAIASSGSYEKARDVDGESLSHILSPHTLRPVETVRGAAVRAASATLADGWSTAATVLGRDAVELMERAGGPQGVVTLASGYARTSKWSVVPVLAEWPSPAQSQSKKSLNHEGHEEHEGRKKR